MNLPKLELNVAPDFQKERLACWLAAWELDRDLGVGADDPDGRAGLISWPAGDRDAELPVAPVSDEPAPEPGQVRLFSPEVRSARNRLLYVAVLDIAGAGRFLVAPYSRFSEPCLPGELLTGRDAPSLRVLCLWNTAATPGVLLARSWKIDVLSNDEFRDALSIRNSLAAGAEPASDLARRVGPPLWHPADPRRQYAEEERNTLRGLSGGSDGVVLYPPTDSAWPIAADPHDSYGTGSGEPGTTPPEQVP